jgi:signal transduction histidine kinase
MFDKSMLLYRTGFFRALAFGVSNGSSKGDEMSDRLLGVDNVSDVADECCSLALPHLARMNATNSGLKRALPESVQMMLDGLVEQVAVLDCRGAIVAVNSEWRRASLMDAYPDRKFGQNIGMFLSSLVERGELGAAAVLRGVRSVCAGERQRFGHLFSESGELGSNLWKIVASRFLTERGPHVLVSIHDVTELMTVKSERRRLTGRLRRAQEEERRRVARELHDSTAQLLVGLQLTLMNLKRARLNATSGALVADCSRAVDEMQKAIRTLSFICHPPSLGDGGLAAALRTLGEGFSRRTGLRIECQIDEIGGAPASVETTLYRLAQEALANIHWHAHASNAAIQLINAPRTVFLVISDDGVGFTIDVTHRTQLGVGIAGMKERVREFGGRLAFQHLERGTALIVALPWKNLGSIPSNRSRRNRPASRATEFPAERTRQSSAAGLM